MPDQLTTPVRIKLDRTTRLEVDWPDGLALRIPIRELRAACPCAGCRDLREQSKKNRLLVLPPTADGPIVAAGAATVGNYAIRLTFSDGHDVGIYSFHYLRELATVRPAT